MELRDATPEYLEELLATEVLAEQAVMAGPLVKALSVSTTHWVCTGDAEALQADFHVLGLSTQVGREVVLASHSVRVGSEATEALLAMSGDAGLPPGTSSLGRAAANPIKKLSFGSSNAPGQQNKPNKAGEPEAATESGSTFTFSGSWWYWELRTNCSNSVHSRFPCSEVNSWQPLVRAKVEIWRIRSGVWTQTCTTYTDSAYYDGWCQDAWQDGDTFVSRVVLERADENYIPSGWRWRILNDGALVWGQSSAQPISASGVVSFGGWGIYGDHARIYGTLQETWEVFRGGSLIWEIYDIEVNHYERAAPADCPAASWYSYIALCHRPGDTFVGRNGNVAAHELGHVFHRHSWDDQIQLNYDFAGNSIGWHGLLTPEWEEVVLLEGLANFVAAATFFEPSEPNPDMVGWTLSTPATGPANPVCHTCDAGYGGHQCEANSMSFYWDVYDTVNDDAWNDGMAVDPFYIFDVFYAFPAGNSNRQRDEWGPGSVVMDHGPNGWDFYWQARYGSVTPNEVIVNEFYSNCVNTGAWD